MAHSGEIVIKGHAPVHSTRVGAIRVDDSVHNFTFDIDAHNFRDLMVKNIGKKPVYIVFSPCALNNIIIPSLSRKNTVFMDETTGWKLDIGEFIIMEYMDFTYIVLKCESGDSTNVQIMGTLYPQKKADGAK